MMLESWQVIMTPRSLKFFKRTPVLNKGTSVPQEKCMIKTKQHLFIGLLCFLLLMAYATTFYQHHHTLMEENVPPSNTLKETAILPSTLLGSLPHDVIEPDTDMEMKPLWSTSSTRKKVPATSHLNLLAIPVGLKQKHNVDIIVRKFLPENFTVILFHYDGNVDSWQDLGWSKDTIHIAAQNQTKWWFAKRFLHPSVVSIYDYIFLWDEDLGVANFDPRRYLEIVRTEGLEISQPALDPWSVGIHHRITVRAKKKKVHRRLYEIRGSTKCSATSTRPPCTGFVEGMAPVFSRSAWHCAWHLIQSDLVHGWGMDMKFGYCAQGDRTKKVGIVDSEYILHQGIQTLGGAPGIKDPDMEYLDKGQSAQGTDHRIEIRRQSTWELQAFEERWNQAVKNDKNWVDPFKTTSKQGRSGR